MLKTYAVNAHTGTYVYNCKLCTKIEVSFDFILFNYGLVHKYGKPGPCSIYVILPR
jgi:hypothetical protein